MRPNRQIQVRTERTSPPWDKLAPMLAALLPVQFQFAPEAGSPPGHIVLSAGVAAPAENISSLTLPSPSPATSAPQEIAVTFADEAAVPFPFRNRSLRVTMRAEPRILVLRQDERALAQSQKGPIWVVSHRGGALHFRSGLPLPAIPSDGSLQDILNGQCFLESLPLLHFLQQCCDGQQYQQPPLRACFMFDDPNLHWPQYGFVNFAAIAARAARGSYHVSFATIPLDTWFTHDATAELFRRHAAQLSLLVHGNNHTKKELGLDYSQDQRISLLGQALRRIERLERSARLKVCRVMAAPHGACSEAMLEQLPRSGFESACISHGSLRAHNPGRPWTETLGYHPTEVICGCPVLPRWSLSGDLTNTILLAAFLGQPIILRGHHQDLRPGLELLDRWAAFINGLGQVVWANMTTLSRLSYQWRVESQVLTLKPLAQRLAVRVPKEARMLSVDASNSGASAQWRLANGSGTPLSFSNGQSIQLPHDCGDTIALEAAAVPGAVDRRVSIGSSATAIARRLVTEGRDRLAFLSARS